MLTKVALLACAFLAVVWSTYTGGNCRYNRLFLSNKPLPGDFPKKIWQVSLYSSGENNELTKHSAAEWQAKHPDYRYECLSDQAVNTFVSDVYRNDRKVRKAFDAIREDRILQADLSINNWIPVEYRDQTNIVLGIEIDKGQGPLWKDSPWTVQISQFTIMAKPNHPIVLRVVEDVCENIDAFFNRNTEFEGTLPHITFDDVITLTGPKVFTTAVLGYLSEHTGIEMNGDEVSQLGQPVLLADVPILPVNGFSSGQMHSNSGSSKDPTALVQHSWVGSWVPTHPYEFSSLSYTS